MASLMGSGTRCEVRRLVHLCWAVLLLIAVIFPISSAQMQQRVRPKGSEPIPEAAVPAVLVAFDKYEVVGLPAAHGLKDVDDFILSLIRNPAFPEKVNDIEMECGNSLYQPILDRYIAGEDVPYAEVRKVWRNTTQPMCGTSGFVEQFFPLVRAINLKLPPGKRLRVLAGDPPIDWDQVKSFQDFVKFARRDDTVAAVMEKEVLSKHRKALMLFGIFHMMHRTRTAVSIYERHYPNVTFIITELGNFGADLPANVPNPFSAWPVPSLVPAKGTWLGALELDHFFTPMTTIHEEDCSVHTQFPPDLQKPMAELVDAFLYLGPQDLRLMEPMPADIALDMDYRMELQRRDIPLGAPGVSPEALKEADQEILKGASDPLYPKLDAKGPAPDLEQAVQSCLKRKNKGGAPK